MKTVNGLLIREFLLKDFQQQQQLLFVYLIYFEVSYLDYKRDHNFSIFCEILALFNTENCNELFSCTCDSVVRFYFFVRIASLLCYTPR